MIMRSVCSKGLRPAPTKKGGVALNGFNEKAISSRVRLIRCIQRKRQT